MSRPWHLPTSRPRRRRRPSGRRRRRSRPLRLPRRRAAARSRLNSSQMAKRGVGDQDDQEDEAPDDDEDGRDLGPRSAGGAASASSAARLPCPEAIAWTSATAASDGPVGVARPGFRGTRMSLMTREAVSVGDPVLEAVADLDPDLLVVGHDEQDDAVVEALAADPPGLEGLDGKILDGRRRPSSGRYRRETGGRWRARRLPARASSSRDRRGREEAGLVRDPAVGRGRDPDVGSARGAGLSPARPPRDRRTAARTRRGKRLAEQSRSELHLGRDVGARLAALK